MGFSTLVFHRTTLTRPLIAPYELFRLLVGLFWSSSFCYCGCFGALLWQCSSSGAVPFVSEAAMKLFHLLVQRFFPFIRGRCSRAVLLVSTAVPELFLLLVQLFFLIIAVALELFLL
jgi:hypothetical protein